MDTSCDEKSIRKEEHPLTSELTAVKVHLTEAKQDKSNIKSGMMFLGCTDIYCMQGMLKDLCEMDRNCCYIAQ